MIPYHEINFVKNRYDKNIAVTEFLSWEEIVDLFSIHTVTSDKDSEMYNFCTFKKDFVCGCENAQLSHCCAENVEFYNALVLDYDGDGATIEGLIQQFDGFRYLGYTSYNHAIKGVDKFRIVFPFDTECPVAEWNTRKNAFLEFAGNTVDKSTIATSRVFYMPACAEENIKFAECWHCDGVTLDWQMFDAPITVYVPPTRIITYNPTEVQRSLDKLFEYEPILDNPSRYSVSRAVARCIGKDAAITEMQLRWPDAQWNGKYKDSLKTPLKSNGPGLNSIKERIRKHEPDYEKDWKKLNNFDKKIEYQKERIKQLKEKLHDSTR